MSIYKCTLVHLYFIIYNVHIHNNGIADRAYIEGFNIYAKVEGEILLIDVDVLQRTQQLTRVIVEEIVKKFT